MGLLDVVMEEAIDKLNFLALGLNILDEEDAIVMPRGTSQGIVNVEE